MADMKIRDFLKSKGLQDNEITYNNGNVYAKGKQFTGATPQADGSTYGDPNKLNQAFNNYSMNDALDTFKTNLAKPRAQFTFDPNTDQAYQSALGAAQRSAQTAGNNASVRLGSKGIGNSQQAMTTENQIQQRAVADVNSNMLPQFLNQAYGRFHDGQVMDDERNRDLLGLAGTYNNLGQQSFNNDRLIAADAERKKQSNLDAARQVGNDLGRVLAPKDDWSNLYNQDDAPLNLAGQQQKNAYDQQQYANQFNEKQTNFENGIATRQLDNSTRSTNASIANSNADNGRANASAAAARGDKEMALKLEIWDRTGRAPAGIPGVEPGTALPSKSGKPTTYKDMPEFEASKAYIYQDPNGALKEIQDNRDMLIKDYGTDGYADLLTLARKVIKDAENE